MARICAQSLLLLAAIIVVGTLARMTHGGWPVHDCREVTREQRHVRVRHPTELGRIPIPRTPAPPTVANPRFDAPRMNLSLDDAIRSALANSEVVRVLGGSSGSTIYDAAITNTLVDQERGVFDPSIAVNNTWNRFEPPVAFPDPLDPGRTLIGGTRTDEYDLDFELSKTTTTGGLFSFGVNDNTSRFQPGVFPLNPQNRTTVDLIYTQPLLQGGGRAANLAPLVIARIDTERSYFQFKDSMQELIRSVVDAYWSLVFARTDLWAREQQVEQAEFALEQAETRARVGDISGSEVAQPRSSLANFRAGVIAAKANVLEREALLRNILGLPPYDPNRITPVSPPTRERFEHDWPQLVGLAEQFRPDLIELKLILEADEQFLLIARNQALPRLDGVALYRWNGLEGTMPVGDHISSPLSRGTDWTLGINFSVPLGLRQGRAQVRQRELLIARDRANLSQGLHNASHLLAQSLRNLELAYAQYEAFRDTRAAARETLELQMGRFLGGFIQYIEVLLAISDWGNAVSSEAQSLAQYNIELATLQRQTGTILESHGVRFWEERFAAVGPGGCLCPHQCYPAALPPTQNDARYPTGDEPSEEFFDLENPFDRARQQQLFELEDIPLMESLSPPEATLPAEINFAE